LRLSIPTLLTATVAVVTVAGLFALALATDAGTAPGNGQQAFDAPGCQPKAYAGPGRTGRYLLGRNCPRPTPVILRRIVRVEDGWRVVWDGSRSFDSMGGRLVSYLWNVEGERQRTAERISVHYRRPGPHSVILYLTNDSGLYGTERQTVRLP
jgi:hypothetical protein